VESFAEWRAKNADRADAAAGFGNGRCNRSASRAFRERQSQRENATATRTNANLADPHRAHRRFIAVKSCTGPISRPAIFAESSISTLSFFSNLSVAPPSFLNLAPVFFEISA